MIHGKYPRTIEIRKKMSQSHLGQIPWNKGKKGLYKPSEETKIKMSAAHKKNPVSFWKGKTMPREMVEKSALTRRGKNHWNWKDDRNSLVKKQERNDSAYFAWRRDVWQRDNFKCKISNKDCAGKIEAHHILGWKSHPELRYQLNNGITLCHAHHPRKRDAEAKLSPYFQTLVAEMK
jgi:hypothetical protein